MWKEIINALIKGVNLSTAWTQWKQWAAVCEHLSNDFYVGSVNYWYMERKQKRMHIFQTQEITDKNWKDHKSKPKMITYRPIELCL